MRRKGEAKIGYVRAAFVCLRPVFPVSYQLQGKARL